MNAFEFLLIVWLCIALFTFITLLFVTAPYGRHLRRGWGWKIDNRLGWVLMEVISPMVFALFYLSGEHRKDLISFSFFALWMLHYINRSLIFPFRIKTKGKQMPLVIMLMAVFFNSVNGYINGYWLGNLAEPYPANWLLQWPFVVGMFLFLFGFLLNLHSDEVLLKLRKEGETGYQIPKGGGFIWVSCPNYLGEMIEWMGFALMTCSPAAWVFFAWTIANLLPRALANHRWYLQNLPDYPKRRKALIPFLL